MCIRDSPSPAPAPTPAPSPSPAPAPSASNDSTAHSHPREVGTRSAREIRADARAEIRAGRVTRDAERLATRRGSEYANQWLQRKQQDIAGDVEKAYGHQDRASAHYGRRAEHGRNLNVIRRGGTVTPAPTRSAPQPTPPVNRLGGQYQMTEALNAKDRYNHHHDAAKSLLKSIGEHLANDKKTAHSYRGYRGDVGPNWGHVGSMENVTKQLGDIHDMLARQGEYAETAKIAEEVEQIDELSKKTLGSYAKKAARSATGLIAGAAAIGATGGSDHGRKMGRTAVKRLRGIDKAVDKLTKEEVEGLDELSKSTIASYVDRTSPSKGGFDNLSRSKWKARVKTREIAKSKLTKEEVDLDEKTLTSAEMKKREEVAQAIERDNPDMPMSKKMAIATAQAKKVAEEIELGESVMSDDAIDHLEKAGAEDAKTTSGGIHYKAGGKEYTLRHNMKRSGHRTVRSAELNQHLDRLKAMKESTQDNDNLCLKEGSFKTKMLSKGINSLNSLLDEDVDE
jgi:hypothetical protein